MLVTCNNKGCLKSSNALFDTNSGEVICQECNRPVTNVTESMKRTLKSFGQIVRAERKAFMLACRACRANREVVLDQNNNTICKICHGPIVVHAAFKLAMQENQGMERVDTSAEKTAAPEPTKNKASKKVSRKKAEK